MQRDEIVAQLKDIGEENDSPPRPLQSQAFFEALEAAVQTKGQELIALDGVHKCSGAIYQFVVEDAGPEGKLVVDLRSGVTWVGEEAAADCIISMCDADMMQWWANELDGINGLLSGRIKIQKGRSRFASWTLKGGMVLHPQPLLEAAREAAAAGRRARL